MNNKTLLYGLVAAVVLIGGIFLAQNQVPEEAPQKQNTQDENTITFTDSGFSPQMLTLSAGETVTFINQSDRPVWPATDVHPTHTVYPESSIDKCGTSEESKIFDACRGLETGESYSFTFERAGEWDYHDHLNPTRTGTIVVE